MGDDSSAERKALEIFNNMTSASLGTIGLGGAPFVSLVTVAPCAGDVVLLLSGMAVHTRNLIRDQRCSLLLVDAGGDESNPLAGARLTLNGKATQLRTCFEIQDLVAKRLQLPPLPREIATFQRCDFAGERDGVRGNRISKHVLRRGDDEVERSTFLIRHPSAEMYADFGDFAFYRVDLESAHLVADFGQIAKLPPEVFRE